MSRNLRPSKARYLTAIICITLLGSLSGNSILIGEAKAESRVDKIEKRLTSLEKELTLVKSDLKSSIEMNVPVGTIMPFGGSAEEIEKLKAKGWLLCDGAKVERRQYVELYNAIGFAFGKPDEKSFNLPDLRGRFVRGVDHEAGRDPDASSRVASAKGGNTGNEVGSVQEDASGPHTHEYSDRIWEKGARSDRTSKGGNRGIGANTTSELVKTQEPDTKETRPRNVFVNYIIKAKSVKQSQDD